MERKMTLKGWLSKSNGKVSAAGFLAQHREFLTTGDLAPFTSPILAKLDKGELLPTPALHEVQSVVLSHILAADAVKGEAKLRKDQEEPKKSKPWTATIFDAKGEVQTRVKENGEIEDLIKSEDNSSALERWCDRRLFDGAPDWYAVMTHNVLNVTTTISRDQAIARILRKPTSAVCKTTGGSTSKLGFGVKAKNFVAKFSHG
jgi:hypothetical protein